MSSPSMVQRSGDTLIVRSVVSGDRLFMDGNKPTGVVLSHPGLGLQPITTGPPLNLFQQQPSIKTQQLSENAEQVDEDLPQCKIKRNYNCVHDNCDFFTQNPRHYLLHIRDVHDEKVKIYDCPNCLYASRHFQKLLRHMKMVHGSAEQLEMLNASKVNTVENEIDKSENVEKKKSEAEVKPKTLHKCSVCPFTTVHPGQLTRHERKDHVKSKFFSCEKCNYVTHIKARFTKHVKYHSMPMIKCDVCDFKTPYKWNLDRHMKNHGGTGAFYCSVCNFTADIKQSLTVHEMNHHLPPAGQGGSSSGGTGSRRKNKVGGSDSLGVIESLHAVPILPQQPLVMDSDQDNSTEDSMQSMEDMSEDSSERNMLMIAHEANDSAVLIKNDKDQFSLQEDSNSKDNSLNFNSRHRIDNEDSSSSQQKKLPRPIPKLIPLQTNQQQKSSSPSNGPLNLSVLSKQSEDKINDDNKGLSLSAQLYGSSYTDDSNDNMNSDNLSIKGSDDSSQQSTINVSSKTIFKKKNASFFDKLKEKLMTSSVESGNLSCNNCGHVSKCLSEHSQHERVCSGDAKSNSNSLFSSGHGSTRCQYCRHRCKSSLDLVIHMQSCSMTGNKDRDSPVEVMKQEKIEIPIHPESEEEASIDDPQAPHPMENIVFVWNSMLQNNEQSGYDNMSQSMDDNETSQNNKLQEGGQNNPNISSTSKLDPDPSTSNSNGEGKKVFKCPHCAFWASTASRFHVHIVGHLNKKPFECSLCSYRSNWRWDITKHIRLKSVRDPDHSEAKVLMTDETGRRNYTKYNKYITVMHTNAPPNESALTGGKKKELKNIIRDITENLAVEKRIAPKYPNSFGDFNQTPMNSMMPFPKENNLAEEIKSYNSDNDPENKKAKKSMWKCKRCSYRNPSREALLLHVKKHTRPNSTSVSPEETKKDSPAPSENGDSQGNQTYRCGHCYQVSNWKHVIQRHCRLKHNGDVKVIPSETNGASPPASLIKLPSPKPSSYDNGKCSKCPFISNDVEKLEQHSKRHVMGPDSIYKCFICSYYVNAEYELLEHLPLHGIGNPEEYIASIIVASNKPNPEPSNLKRYQCSDCPYETNSKSQFMYHEQFHKSNNAAFKCDVCNYQVSKRHLLHQHMKVHGITHQKDIIDYMAEIEPNSDSPLLWVHFEGDIRKMYKCIYCPFVTDDRPELVDHEKMHVLKDVIPSLDHMNECPNCSFICDNMREFWLHTDVHKEDYVKVICNVDLAKSDDEQLEHIRNVMDTSITPINKNKRPFNMIIDEYNANGDMPREHMKYNLFANKIPSPPKDDFKMNRSSIMNEQMTLLKEMLSAPSSAANNSLYHTSNAMNYSMNESLPSLNNSANVVQKKPERMIHFCSHCPARFTIEKEYVIHMKFHVNRLPYQCKVCSYTARQQSHLMTHNTVHGREYQKKTRSLQSTLPTHPEHLQPNVVMIVSGMNVSEPVWIVVEHGKTADSFSPEDLKQPQPPVYKPVPKHFLCTLCPAKFFKNAALHYHLSLHGGTGQYKCKQCNYSVKTIGNLVKHESVHSDIPIERTPKNKGNKQQNKPQSSEFDSGDEMGNYKNIPLSGTDLFQHKTEAEKKAKTEKKTDDHKLKPKPNDHFPPVLHADPQFGILMHGNPDFIYPTYLKNGRQKEKRYKCHKCPSAFEKREQYKVHLSLHNSNQRYKCELCDYSVKYYANYVQHMRKHQMNADAHAARNNNATTSDIADNNIGTPKNISFAIKTLPKHIVKDAPKLSMSEQQTLKLSARRRSSAASGKEPYEEKKTFRCLYCPYINLRRDALDNHMRRHKVVSGMETNYECTHCDYTAPQSHILREHLKFHFNNPKHTTPDYYSNYNSVELFISKIDPDTNKPGRRSCVFKSKRKPAEPLLIPIKRKKVYVMPGSGEQVK